MTQPIAVVSQSCVFPESFSPQRLWKNFAAGRDLLSMPDPDRWRADPSRVMDRDLLSIPAGYVDGFDDIFDPDAFELDGDLVRQLDPMYHWLLHCAKTAYTAVNQAEAGTLTVLFGNLSLPTEGLSKWAEAHWTGGEKPHPYNRFASGLPSHLVAKSLGRPADAFCLDAACASSLYAIGLGCEKLREKRTDLVLAGAVNRADPLFLHIGFGALQALSPTGRSRPFHRRADGLVPTEGAGFVGLKRLDDAVDHGDEIHGVIRGVGLTNDGRSDGLLVPASRGQVRAIESAYHNSGVAPDDVSYVECHATGTAVGDARELHSLGDVFGDERAIPVGSHKSNMGHAITAAGLAGLFKILEAMKREKIPPTIHCDEPIDTLDDGPFRLVEDLESWDEDRKVAALSAFGFGGNNSHLVVENWRGTPADVTPGADLDRKSAPPEVAVVGIGIVTGAADDADEFRHLAIDGGKVRPGTSEPLDEIELPLDDLRFPPRDLEESLPQQIAMLKAAIDAAGCGEFDGETTGVFTGMQTDPDIARHGLRARLDDPAEKDAVADELTAATVVGSLPNIVANRINAHFDWRGYSASMFAEQQSGDVALREACQAIERGELDAALVGAVDMATHPVHTAALEALGEEADETDAAIALMLQRRDRAVEKGHRILATIDDVAQIGDEGATTDLPRAHSASGLMGIAASVLLPEYALSRTGNPRGIGVDSRISTPAMDAPPRTTVVRRNRTPVLLQTPRIRRVDVDGEAFNVVFETDAELSQKVERLRAGDRGVDAAFAVDESVDGEVAQLFTGAAAAYRGMGRALCLGFPALVDHFGDRFDQLDVATRWMFHPDADATPSPLDKLFGSSVLSQLHAGFMQRVADVRFDCAIGFSSGETNALFAGGVWSDFDGLLNDFVDAQIFSHHLGGDYEVLRRAWADQLDDGTEPDWQTWRILGPREEVDEAVSGEPLAQLLMINAPNDVSIGGHPAAIRRIVDGLDTHRAIHLDYDIAVHCPQLELVADLWREVHDRPVEPTNRRLYSHAHEDHYEPTRENVAQALLEMGTDTVDFPAVIEKAWDDGVRVFVEHGPRATLGPWVERILGDRSHRVVSLDRGRPNSLRPLADAIARLDAWGVDVDIEAFNAHIEAHSPQGDSDDGRRLSIVAHRPPVRLREADSAERQTLPEPPFLPPVDAPAPRKEQAQRRETEGASHTALPQHFHLQQQAFHRYLDVVQTQSQVHEEFLERTHRMWELAGLDRKSEVRNRKSEVGNRKSEMKNPSDDRRGVRSVELKNDEPGGVEKTDQKPGPTFSRDDLIVHASGKISEIFGPMFEQQDDYDRQVRMPEPPLLFADRVTGIDAEPGEISTGTIWTETDVTAESWYLFCGRVPPGVLIEAGQADLMLISWMGVDFENAGERTYRLLGCELTYRGELPKAGDTMEYDIHVDGHAKQGDVRLFFFHSDCRVDGDVRLSVRHGQAGFFTDEELAESMGVIWEPDTAEFRDDVRLDPPRVSPELLPTQLSRQQVQQFADGDPAACFGTGYERLLCHRRTPNVHRGKMCLIGAVEKLDVDGGPLQRGYLRSAWDVSEDDWFFDGHFKNDPCMPGTLMVEAGMQAMSLYMIALGMTLDCDGWRFEPEKDVTYELRCRGQVTPSSERLVYEIFVEEVIDGERPTLVADILATVDGLKAFHARGMRIQLVEDTPLSEELIVDGTSERDPRALREDTTYDELSMRAAAMGPARLCMGEQFAVFDGPKRMPRLPGPPYQFLSRVTDVTGGSAGDAGPGTEVVAEWDVPQHAWHFDAAGWAPSAVTMEAALQACGWLSLYSGAVLDTERTLHYRNLDGSAVLHRPISAGAGPLQTSAKLVRDSRSGDLIIQSFEVDCRLDGDVVYEMETTFGFFPKEALLDQSGLPPGDDEGSHFEAPANADRNLSTPPDPEFAHLWPGKRLRMIDRITAVFDDGDRRWLRAEKNIDPSEWFFKAHFYQDPVMPGSLGVEAMLQTLRFHLLDGGFHRRFDDPKVEPVACKRPFQWTYRGQVIPENDAVGVLLSVDELVESDDEIVASASASLWVDGLRIYEAKGLALRIAAH